MPVTSPPRRTRSPIRPAFVHRWLPVALALALAVGAGWSIMRLNAASYRARQDRASVPSIHSGVVQTESLLLTSAKKRLAGHGPSALAAIPDAPPQMAVYFAETFASLRALGVSSGHARDSDTVSRALLAMTVTQDRIYAGGVGSLDAARRAPLVVRTLRASFAALDKRLADRARFRKHLASAGTMLIMLLAALSLIVLLRRFDRMRSRLTDELHVQAMHDPMTGLANRRQLARDLRAVLRAASAERPARLVVFDLDGFKAYNDAFGHHGGDLARTRAGRCGRSCGHGLPPRRR
jgi:hypothetical protein